MYITPLKGKVIDREQKWNIFCYLNKLYNYFSINIKFKIYIKNKY